MRATGRMTAVLAAAGLTLLGPASAAPAAGGLEQIQDYAVTMALQPDGSMRVSESISYDFGSGDRHGITRDIPVQFDAGKDRVREYPISDIQVSSPSGAPADVQVSQGPAVNLRIGDPNRTVTGLQTYVISYRVRGVTNSFPDHQELYWNAIGDEWSVSVATASATVSGPAAVNKATCFKGFQGSTQTCDVSVSADGAARFTAADLGPATGLTVVASFPAGTFPGAAPIYATRQSVGRAFSLTAATGAGALGVFALLAGGAVALVARKGRDEQYLGVTPGLQPGLGQQQRTARTGMFRRPVVAVQFTPPDRMLPGQLGTLIDEQANVVDVTATIVDLAVRGFLTIEEVSEPGFFRGGDWRLAMTSPAPAEHLRGYEFALLHAVFDQRAEVLLSDLKRTFRADLQRVQSMLYTDVTRNGWFRGDPSSVRSRWQFLGVLAVAGGAGLTFVLTKVLNTRLGLLGLAAAAAGLVLLVLAPRVPARTAKGTALLAQARGFRTYLETAEANQIRFEEGQDLFSRYLPFAIVFGVAERWAKVFAQLAASGAAVSAPTWYVGHYYAGGMFDYTGFGRSMDSFATTTAGAIAAATPSSSGDSGFGGGGFSGGGGGGGGGGSW